MKKIMKILKKVVFAVVCFSLLPCTYSALAQIGASATPAAPISTNESDGLSICYNPAECHVEVRIPEIGKRIALADLPEIYVEGTVHIGEEYREKDVIVCFGALVDEGPYVHNLPVMCDKWFDTPVRYLSYDNRTGEESYPEFMMSVYMRSRLYYFFENGTSEFETITSSDVDFYHYVDLTPLAAKKELTVGDICLYAKMRCNLINPNPDKDDNLDSSTSFVSDGIAIATDGDYIAFSYESVEDAKAILAGASSEPPENELVDEPSSFWDKISDFFDGCD